MILSRNYSSLKASSLVETVVALTICAACLAIAIVIFVQISMHTGGITQIKATHQVDELIYRDWLSATTIEDDHITYPEYTFSKTKQATIENSGWSEIHYKTNFLHQEVTKSIFLFDSHE